MVPRTTPEIPETVAATAPVSTLAALRKLPLLAGLDEAELDALSSRFRRREVDAGTVLFHEGDEGQTLYCLLRGTVSIERIGDGGAVVQIARRGPGEYFGELALLDDLPRSADAIAETDVILLLLDRRDLKQYLGTYPDAAWQMLRTLSRRLREASDRMVGSETRDALGRLTTHLVEIAEAVTPAADGSRRLADLSDSRLAQRIGARRETVNRRLSNLKKLGIVRRDGADLILVDLKRLKTLPGRSL